MPDRGEAHTNAQPAPRWASTLFVLLWLFIIAVSSIDGYLVYRHRQQIVLLERNPLGRALLAFNDGNVWYLLAAKFIGTVIACAAILLIHRANRRLGMAVVTTIAGLQFWLLCFLLFT